MEVGRFVQCIETIGCSNRLSIGGIYKILEKDHAIIRVRDNYNELYGWRSNRFTLLPKSTVLDAIYGEE